MKKPRTLLTIRLGMRLRELRTARGWTQGQLARRAHVERGYLAHLEAGDHCPSLPTLMDLANVLGAKPGDILRVVDEVFEAAS